jgi:hypothetical protein
MKLTARGRTVLAQVSIIRDTPVGASSVSLSGNLHETRKIRTEYALLSDGVIGVKHTFLRPDGTVDHSAGWKVKSRLKKNLKPTDVIERWTERYTSGGFTRVV